MIDFRADKPHLRWLEHRASGWQFGEAGVLQAMAEAAGHPGSCVEIGAGDGESLPLTIDWFYQQGREVVLFEADEASREKLRAKYPQAEIGGRYPARQYVIGDIEVCVIDVDGIDSQIMECIIKSDYQPCILMVEHMDAHYLAGSAGPERLPPWMLGREIDGGFNLQDSAEALLAIAHGYGYYRVGTTRVNSIFARADIYPKLLRPIGAT